MLPSLPGGLDSKASACNAGDRGSIPGSGRSPGEANGNPLQYYCLENPMDGGGWQLTVLGLVVRQSEVNIINLLLNGSTNWSRAYVLMVNMQFFHLVGFSVSAKRALRYGSECYL